jgi:hypothetical protein
MVEDYKGLKFDKIRKVEGMKDGKLVWQFATAGYLDGRHCGIIVAETGQDCQNQVDYALANPDEYVSKQMSSGNL